MGIGNDKFPGRLGSFLKSIDTKYHIIGGIIPGFNRPTGQVLAYPTIVALAALTLLLAGCAPSANQGSSPGSLADAMSGAPETPALKVVATTTVLADLARNVGGELAEVTSLVPTGADVHSFQSTPANSITIGAAGLIISNGAGLDDFLTPVLTSAQSQGSIHIVASEGLEAGEIEEMAFPEGDAAHTDETEDSHGEEHSEGDPHFWLDPTLTIHYVERILEGLTEADPINAQQYTANGQAYIEQLRQLDEEIAETLAQVPPERRHLVTFHDAYGYFGRHYGWKVSAFVPSDASDVTPGDIVTIMAQIKLDGIPAVFAEPQFNSDVLRQASRDAGVKVGTIRSLVDDQTPTYVEMMRANARSLVENLV